MKTKNTKRMMSTSMSLLMITVAILGATGTVLADEGWPSLYHDNARTSYTTGLAPVEGPTSYRWMAYTYEYDTLQSSVIVVDDYVYAFTSFPEPGIKRFNYRNGLDDEEWFIPMHAYPSNDDSITIDNGRIYFHENYYDEGTYRMTCCYDIESQEKIWEFNAYDFSGYYSFLKYAPTIAFNNVYCLDKDSRVYCLDASSGAVEWSTDDDLSTPDPIAIDVSDDKLYVSAGHDLYCYEATPDGVDNGFPDPPGATYDTLWIYNGYAGKIPLANDGKVYIGFDDTVYCFNGDDGSYEWDTILGDIVGNQLALAHGYLYATNSNEYAFCLNTTTGAIEWETQVNSNDNLLGSLALAGDILVIGASRGWIYCLDATTGDTLWTHHEGGGNAPSFTYPLALYEGWIYLYSKGDIYCYGGDTHYPDTPDELRGPDRGREGVKYWFSTDNVDDIDGKDLYYMFDWGDGENSGWIGPYEPGEDVEVHAWHRWEEPGDYTVKVKVKDNYYETDWVEKDLHIDYLEIHGVTGGLGVSASIKNMADYSKDIDWTIQVAGGIFGFHVFKEDSSGILSLGPDETEMIYTDGMLFGLGPIEIKIEAECTGESITEIIDAFILGFYIIA